MKRKVLLASQIRHYVNENKSDIWSIWPVLLANSLLAVVGDVFGPAIAALTLGLFARQLLARRMGRNSAFDHAGGHPPGQLKGQKDTMNRSITLGLAMVASSVIGATAVNGLHAQNKARGAYAALDLRAINSPDVFKTLPSKTGDFDGHTA
jgi:hypothetical protein